MNEIDAYASSDQQKTSGSSSTNSSKQSSAGEQEGDEIVYAKDYVAIHPNQNSSEAIIGRLKLIKRVDSLFMTWIPYRRQSLSATLSEEDKSHYTIQAVPFSDVRSILRCTPKMDWHYVTVVSSGVTFPPLYFYLGSGGVEAFLSEIEKHVYVVRSAHDANVYLFNEFQDPFQRTLSSLGIPRAVIENFGRNSALALKNARQRQKYNDPARDLSIQVPEKCPLVREKVPEPAMDPLDLDKLSLLWGMPRLPPLETKEWSTFLDSEGRVTDSKALRKRIFYGGVEEGLRKEVWPFLLGYHSYDSTYAERKNLVSVKKSEYEMIKNQWKSISKEQEERNPKFQKRKSLIEEDVVRTDRSITFYNDDDSPNIKCLHDILLTYTFYYKDLGYCQGMNDFLSPILYVMGDESESFWCFVVLMKRLGPNFRNDGQGMHFQLSSLSKLVELLDIPLHNHFKQQGCLHYSFCFKWVLVQFKSALEYETVVRLWEILWTHYRSEHLHSYVCVAILKRHRSKILGEQMEYDEILNFTNNLVGQIDHDAILRDAEALSICAGENGESCISLETPPSLLV